MRRVLVITFTAVAAAVALASPASAEPRCYTVGVPGQDTYQYCSFLPGEPQDLLR